MKQITLRNYNSVNEFIEALEKVGLDYDSYDDPDEMWDDFMKSVNK